MLREMRSGRVGSTVRQAPHVISRKAASCHQINMRIVIGNKAGLKGRRMGPSPVIAARLALSFSDAIASIPRNRKKAVAIMKMSAT
jgi:hypothetical protein